MVSITFSASSNPALPPLHAWGHLARLSLSPLTRTDDSPSGGSVPLHGGMIDKRSALLLMSVLDLMASAVITGGIVYARHDLRRFVRTAEAAMAEVRDFSVLLRRLPHDRHVTAAEVSAYVEAAIPGVKVVQCCIARDVGEQLVALRQLQEAGAPEADGDDSGCAWLATRRAARKLAR